MIKRRNSGEADRILTVFTKEQGKIFIKASGVRRIRSRRSAHIELLNYVHLQLYKANGWPIVTEAQVIEDFSAIKRDFAKIGLAYHFCELIDGLCPENQEVEDIFRLFERTLQRCAKEEHSDALGKEFEMKLLSMLGYGTESTVSFNTHAFIENIMERKLKSRNIFLK